MNERKKTRTILLCVFIGALLCAIIVLTLFRAIRPLKQRMAVEEMITRVPALRAFVEERVELFDDVEAIFQEHRQDFTHLYYRDNHITFTPNSGGYYENLEDSQVFSEVEKGKIYELFTVVGPLVSYSGSQFGLDDNEYSLDYLAELRLAKVEETGVEDWLTMSYYMEEVADDWYAYVTPCIYPKIFLQPGEYREQRLDRGLVQLSD